MNRNTKHTPGPWKVVSEAGYAGHKVDDARGRSVAAFPSSSTRPKEERNANAALIAAAPELLALVEEVAVTGGIGPQEFSRPGGWLERARAALAKAEGR